ncbi:MAG: hypothetical protein ACKVJF_04135, partial [Flavobacteriales bacterium]
TRKGQIASAKTPRNDGGEITGRLLHCVRNDGRITMTEAKGHCERNEVERGNLINGTRISQIAQSLVHCPTPSDTFLFDPG